MQQLFRLDEDPRERRDISAEHQPLIKQLHETLAQWRKQTLVPRERPPPPMSAESIEALRALGYLE